MKVNRIIDRLISHNEVVAIWVEDTNMTKHLLWRGMAHEIPKKYRKRKFRRFFGTIPRSIVEADTINILLEELIPVLCRTCSKWGTMECPNSFDCFCTILKPHWEWKGE